MKSVSYRTELLLRCVFLALAVSSAQITESGSTLVFSEDSHRTLQPRLPAAHPVKFCSTSTA